ncbi:MAG: hypothetical protein ACOH2H_15385 [Cypionkella sp.]
MLAAHERMDAIEELRDLNLMRLAFDGDPEKTQAWLNRRRTKPVDPDKQTGSITYL